jgi:DNA invertase Pin-like site-specific DNA recombinase
MANAPVVHRDRLPPSQKLRRAAQYVRMSSDPQKYSIEIQAAAIAAYAARRGIEIVDTYSDPGRSGLTINRRDGLRQLLDDVQSRRAEFDCILVYDVSRWGRFQDVDESAYYEFICKRAGIEVHYCEDEFENDGSLASVVLKNLKRVRAADFSRQLSKNVFLGQSNIVSRGFWRGGPAAYGLRRMLVDENGKPKMVLQYGQRKNLKNERVILVPGPKSEIKVICGIFTSFVDRKKNRTEIARKLNAGGILTARGKPWTTLTVSNVLENEVYLGHLVYNRRSTKLGERTVKNPPDMWIRRDNAYRAIITPALFKRAQKRLLEVEYGKKVTDQQLIDRLKVLLRRKGRLSVHIIQAAKSVPHPDVYTKRFGSLTRVYELAGFKPEARYRFLEVAAEIDHVICSTVDDIIIELRRRGLNASFLQELYLLTIAGGLTVAVAVARAVSDGDRKSRRWEVRRIKYKRADLTLLIRMDTGNLRVRDYFLVPTAALPLSKDRKKLRVSDRLFSLMRLESLDAVMVVLHDRLLASKRNESGPPAALRLPMRRATMADRAVPTKLRRSKKAQATGHSKETNGRARR